MNKPLRVLIVEDSENDAMLLVRKLTHEGGYEPYYSRADSLEGFNKALTEHEWDVIISDHSMPHFSAICALRTLRERQLDIPLVIVSGTIEPGAAVAAMKTGASDYIMKSDLTRLIPAIEREVREARSRSEKRSTEKQLQQAQRMESIGRLAGGVAHDFNNILTAIAGYSYFLLGDLSPNDPNRADVEEIKKAGERATSLTRQLLAFSRQQVLRPRVLDLNAIVREISSMLRRIVGENMKLVSTLAGDLGRTNADPGQIEQVLLNLVVNAQDAMPQGGTITIETANVELNDDLVRTHLGARPGPHVLLAVSDTGTGMTPETLSRLFEPFFTTKEQGKGTGLGLATVYGIVKQSGGSIFVHSEQGIGSAFKVYLPRVPETVEPAAPLAPTPAKSSRGSETLLVVEDDEMVRKFILRLLSQHGYTLLEARTAEEALQICERRADRIHLLLADIVMPGMRGDDLAKRLLAQRPDMKVILTSGYTDAGVVRLDLLDSQAIFIQKPVEPAALTKKIREMLDTPT